MIPVSVWMEKGIGRTGFTREENSSWTRPSAILLALISMISWLTGLWPVVTVEKTTTGSCTLPASSPLTRLLVSSTR